MNTTALLSLKSHIDGKNADVDIFTDRIEWARSGDVSKARLIAGVATMGASLLATGTRKGGGTEMIPVSAISSVTTAKDGLRYYKLVVIASGNTVEFRVDKADAERSKTLLTQLIVGSHPSQQPAATQPATPAQVVVAPPMTAPTATPTVGDRLRELAALRDEGLLSDDEFQAQKTKLLS